MSRNLSKIVNLLNQTGLDKPEEHTLLRFNTPGTPDITVGEVQSAIEELKELISENKKN